MSYDPNGPVAKVLEPLLANELASTYGIVDDAQDTAEFINDRIGQGKSASEICADVKDVINIPIDEAFIGRVFTEIARLNSLQASGQPLGQQQQQQQQNSQQQQQVSQQPLVPQQPEPQQQSQQQQPNVPEQVSFTMPTEVSVPAAPAANPFFPNGAPVSTFESNITQDSFQKPIPSGPAGKANNQKKNHVDFKTGHEVRRNTIQKGKPTRGGISKDYDSRNLKHNQRKSVNATNLQRTLNLASDDVLNIQPHTQRPPKGRCPQFPHCPNKECELSHPTKKCFQYPNCKNPPGTCDFLHPLEDQALMQELSVTKARFQERKNNNTLNVELCKFGVLCSKELCPFGHPTPANPHAKIMVQKWCRQNKNCTDENCVFAHSSPNYQAPAPVAPAPKVIPAGKPGRFPIARVTTTLEQCKFGKSCTNPLCNKRHATSMVACRGGYNCTRMNCTFAHPIMEECRFGIECRNKPCFYIHPDGRERQLFSAGGNESTLDRPFAVPEDQVMEQAVHQ